MFYFLMRPISWGTFLLIQAIGMPLVYNMGKASGMKKCRQQIAQVKD